MQHKVKKENDQYIIEGEISMKQLNPESPAKNGKNEYKTAQLSMIISAICALLNSGGGKLELQLSESETKKEISDFLRVIEQRVRMFVNFATYNKLVTLVYDQRSHRIVVFVKITNTSRLFTINYNYCLPTNTQVVHLPPSEDATDINDRLESPKASSEPPSIERNSHQKDFVRDEEISMSFESDTVQFKNLASNKTKSVSLAKRITGESNKFSLYVSAFANHRGGHIYYGISDEGIIMGQEVEDETEIRDAISTKIKDLPVWPRNSNPEEGMHWNVYFKSVKNPGNEHQRNEIPERFIVVVYVAPFHGRVFTKEPESYHITHGSPDPEIKRMEFSEWRERYLNMRSGQGQPPSEDCTKKPPTQSTSEAFTKEPPPTQSTSGAFTKAPKSSHIVHVSPYQISPARCNWSSTNVENSCIKIQEYLQRLINDALWHELKKQIKNILNDKKNGNDIKLFTLSKKLNACFRKGEINAADKCKKELARSSSKSVNPLIFEVMQVYLSTAMERCKGDYERCYEIAKGSLHLVNQIPVGFLSASFFALIGTVAGILAAASSNPTKANELLEEAKKYCNITLEHWRECNGRNKTATVDIAQKAFINLAILHFGFALSGDLIHENITDEDFNKGKSMRDEITQTVHDGCLPTIFREVQIHFVDAFFCYRVFQKGNTEGLKKARRHAQQAREMAHRCEFKEMERYAKKLEAMFTKI